MQEGPEIQSDFSRRKEKDGKVCITKCMPASRGKVYAYLQNHPMEHIPAIASVRFENGMAVVEEEYIPGPSLLNKLETGRLEKKEILFLMDQILDGLHQLHQAGIIHRDLKPEHILLCNDKVYLIDFDASRFFKKGKNMDTEILGTAGYASPEQFGFEQSDARSDIYSAGKILEEMDEEGAFCRISRRALHVDKTKRYRSAEEMKKDLHSRLLILPGITNTSWQGKIASLLYTAAAAILALSSSGAEANVQHPSLFRLYMFWFLYLPLFFLENLAFFTRFWMGNHLPVRFLYALAASLLFLIAGIVFLVFLDVLLPGTF